MELPGSDDSTIKPFSSPGERSRCKYHKRFDKLPFITKESEQQWEQFLVQNAKVLRHGDQKVPQLLKKNLAS
jgi:hypothetical protein